MRWRYRRVRHITAVLAIILFSPLVVWITALTRLQSLETSAQHPSALRIVVGVPHFAGDHDGQAEALVRRELRDLASSLPLESRSIDQVVAPQDSSREPGLFEHDRVIESLNPIGGQELIWGTIESRDGATVARLYESNSVEGADYGSRYNPPDFALPVVPLEALGPIVRLIFATIGAEARNADRTSAANTLRPAIAAVQHLLAKGSGHWDADAYARTNFILAYGEASLAAYADAPAPARDALYYYLCAFDGWRGSNFASERVLTLRYLAADLILLNNLDHRRDNWAPVEQVLRTALAEYPPAPDDSRDRASIQMSLGDVLESRAARGESARFADAITAYQAALKAFPRDRSPAAWANIEYQIAVSEATMARSQPDVDRQRDAIRLIDEIFTVRTRQAMPYEWAITQEALGEMQLDLSERQPGAGYRKQAISAERAALEILTPDNYPEAWGRAQVILGTALSQATESESDPAQLEEAIAALRAGATAELRQRAPDAWIQAQFALATALEYLGQMEWRSEADEGTRWYGTDERAQRHLVEAVTAARAGLEEATEKTYPILWANLESRLGQSLEALGEREANSGNSTADYHFEQAITAYRDSMRVLTNKNASLNWADAESGMGDALEQLGDHQSNVAYLQQAITAYRQCATIETPDKFPDEWRTNQQSLAEALEVLGRLEKGVSGDAPLQEAVAIEENALKTTSPDADLSDWLSSCDILARAQKDLGRRESGTTHLEQAARVYRDELQHISPDRSPRQWKEANDGLSEVAALLHARGASG